ncbi:MAG: argininosuccinate synthase, partial [Nanoarchaeota archaeon]|nr:argininosuccinate synthase [Nanoarchaeota archaeon]
TSIGNDQVRFDSALLSLKPDIKIICPIKALNITRDEEIEYLKEKGIEVPSSSKKYSINENVFGITVSGSEIDKNLEPSKEAYTLTKQKNIGQEYITIEFDQGLPIKLNSQPKDGLEILKELNKLIGAYGFGAKIYTGDCIIGIKGHIMFEAPGLLALIKAHQKLEQITLTKKQLAFNSLASQTWSDLVYSALYYEPLTKDLEEYADSVQEKVTGKVKIKLIPNNIEIVELQSNNSLIKDKIATYAQKANWNAEQADGFIKLYTLQEVIANAASK